MAADRVGEHGDKTTFWNNSYMVMGTKVEYYFDPLKGKVVNDDSFERITMKDGLGAQEKMGVTKENLSFSDIVLSVTDPKSDAPAEERPITYVDPDYEVVSAPYANSEVYSFEYSGNADGYLTVTNSHGEKLFDEQEVGAGETVSAETLLEEGVNSFKISFAPLEDYLPDNDEYKRLSSYETKEFNYAVKYESINDAEKIYVSADGFAAKLTAGDRNVFNDCIAYNNADDGWDLFAKVETGMIGKVKIQNCVAFANGYGLDGSERGNGNGFKMGGSNMPGQHMLINSVAWGNKGKGIDSNSGPDIQIYDCKSFNNGSNNVALYTNNSYDTSYYVDGLISYRTDNRDEDDKIVTGGTQNLEDIYKSNNYFWTIKNARNSDDKIIEDDWFESLEAPVADASDPLAVALSMRTSDGKIDLGPFLKLSAKGAAHEINMC